MPVWMVEDLGMPTQNFGLLFTVNTLLIVFLEVRLNGLTAHWSPARAMSVGSALCTVGFGALAFLTSYWGVVATVVVWTFGEMILFPSTAAYVSELAPPARRGVHGLLLDDLRDRLHPRALGGAERARGGRRPDAVARLPRGGHGVHGPAGAGSGRSLRPPSPRGWSPPG